MTSLRKSDLHLNVQVTPLNRGSENPFWVNEREAFVSEVFYVKVSVWSLYELMVWDVKSGALTAPCTYNGALTPPLDRTKTDPKGKIYIFQYFFLKISEGLCEINTNIIYFAKIATVKIKFLTYKGIFGPPVQGGNLNIEM